MSDTLLSLCCGAAPQGALRHHLDMERVSGWCSCCHEWGLFAPQGVLETQSRFLRLPPLRAVGEVRPAQTGHANPEFKETESERLLAFTMFCEATPDLAHGRCADPQAERERQLRAIERRHAWRDILGTLVAGWGWLLVMLACLVATGVWGACREPKGGQRGSQGGGEVLGDGAGLRVAHARSVTAEVTQ